MQAGLWDSATRLENRPCTVSALYLETFPSLSPFPAHGCQQGLPCSPLYPWFPFFAPDTEVTGLGLACFTPAVGLDAFINTLWNIDLEIMIHSNFYASETALKLYSCCLC